MHKKSGQFLLIGLAMVLLGAILMYQVYDVPALYPEEQSGAVQGGAAAPSENRKINLNTATMEELTGLNGIGETKAAAIIRYREENGGYAHISELLNVTGIGEHIFEQIKNDITIE